jgi:hypothetical protein
MKRLILVVALCALAAPLVFTQTQGNGFGIEFGAGIAGSLSYFEAGVKMPKINDRFFIDVKARFMSAITWTTFVNMETAETVSFHPVVVGGVVSMGTVGPLVNDELRIYGGTDMLLGYSFTPYDSLAYGVGNLIPPNLTFGVWGHFGFEYFLSQTSSVYIQSGGGFKSLLVEDKTNAYAVASSWLGSGFGIQMGSAFYF